MIQTQDNKECVHTDWDKQAQLRLGGEGKHPPQPHGDSTLCKQPNTWPATWPAPWATVTPIWVEWTKSWGNRSFPFPTGLTSQTVYTFTDWRMIKNILYFWNLCILKNWCHIEYKQTDNKFLRIQKLWEPHFDKPSYGLHVSVSGSGTGQCFATFPAWLFDIARCQPFERFWKSYVQSTQSSKKVLWLLLASNIISLCPLTIFSYSMPTHHIFLFWKKVQRTNHNKRSHPDWLTKALWVRF